MRVLRNFDAIPCLLLGLALGLPAGAEEQAADRPPTETAESAPKASPPVLYVPPGRGSVKTRVGGATRGSRSDLPRIQVLAPDHLGLTTTPQPNLYWVASAPVDAAVHFTLVEQGAAKPLLEIEVPAPTSAGTQVVRLAEHGVQLTEGRDYQWFVALVPDPEHRSKDVLAGGAIEYRSAESVLGAPREQADFERFAQGGVWYDALDTLQQHLATDPAAGTKLAALLAQAGLEGITEQR